jgi:hypothetical protein
METQHEPLRGHFVEHVACVTFPTSLRRDFAGSRCSHRSSLLRCSPTLLPSPEKISRPDPERQWRGGLVLGDSHNHRERGTVPRSRKVERGSADGEKFFLNECSTFHDPRSTTQSFRELCDCGDSLVPPASCAHRSHIACRLAGDLAKLKRRLVGAASGAANSSGLRQRSVRVWGRRDASTLAALLQGSGGTPA